MFFGLWPLTSMVFGSFHHCFQWFSMARNNWSNDGSVPNSSSGLIFVKIRAESGRIFSKNPGKIRAKIRAKLKCCDFVVFYDMGHVQTAILPFGKQLHNALNMHKITKIRAKSQKSGRYPGDFPQMPGYPGAPGFIRAT